MRVLDFDNTIYNGESPLDFYLFSLRYRPGNIRYLPPVVLHLIRYHFSLTSADDLERAINRHIRSYLSSFDDIPTMVQAFWDTHIHKIRPWYSPRPDDVIMTASFNYTMDEVVKRLGIQRCICSTIDYDTHELIHLNFGENKVKSFRDAFGEGVVPEEFYSDNLVDLPMFRFARKAFLVKGNTVTPFDADGEAKPRRHN